jgi:hypothetical protein
MRVSKSNGVDRESRVRRDERRVVKRNARQRGRELKRMRRLRTKIVKERGLWLSEVWGAPGGFLPPGQRVWVIKDPDHEMTPATYLDSLDDVERWLRFP